MDWYRDTLHHKLQKKQLFFSSFNIFFTFILWNLLLKSSHLAKHKISSCQLFCFSMESHFLDYILIKANSIFHLYRLPDNSIGKNHIQSSSSFSQNCSFCLLWIWYFPNELYHMQIEFTNICSTYFQKIVRLAHHWSNENATHSFSKLYPYVFPVTFQKYLKRDCFQPLNFCKFPYRYEQHDNLCPGYL